MIWKMMLALSLALCVLCDKYANSEQKIERYTHHGDLSHIGDHEPEHHDVYAWAYPSYEFSYHVDDPHTHDQKAQHEARDGDKVIGSYWFIQPDGYKRIVKYRSDHKSGFEADVTYIHHEQHRGTSMKEHHDKHVSKENQSPHVHPHDGKQHYQKREQEEEHKVVKHHDGSHERRNEKRGRNHHHNVQNHHEKHEHNEENLPQVRHHEIKKVFYEKHEHKEERKPQIYSQQVKEDHDRYGVKEELKVTERHDSGDKHRDEGHDEREQSRQLRRDGDEHSTEQFWRGTYGVEKESKNNKNDHHAGQDKNESWGWKKGRNEEHWKHGVLVGWTEGIGRKIHRDHKGDDKRERDDDSDNSNNRMLERRRGHDDYQDHEDRHKAPLTNFKPLIPYGQRLH